jgi:class 3 adenylate cyclase/YHS domain-containing protein
MTHEARGQVERAFLFADLSGYTALTEAHGNAAAADVVQRFIEIAVGALRGGASVLERVGDELVIVANEAASAVETAVALRNAIAREPMFPAVRAGIHRGHVVERGGQYFGGALNVAARVATLAGPGQIVCTQTIREHAALPGVGYRAMGVVRLRNIPEAIALFELVVEVPDQVIQVDPVCRMQIAPAAAIATVTIGPTTYLFCSDECAASFRARPADYVASGS